MKRSAIITGIVFLCAVMLLSACAPSGTAAPIQTDQSAQGYPNSQMANPASVYCQEKGGTSQIRTASDGSQSGVCVFPDGSECDEWAYYRSECAPGGKEAAYPSTGACPAFENKAAEAARGSLAGQLKVDPCTITMTSLDQATYTDTCLGLGGPAESCAQEETQGFKVVLTADGKNYTFHTDLSGENVRQEPAD
jgi:putative hemolysin